MKRHITLLLFAIALVSPLVSGAERETVAIAITGNGSVAEVIHGPSYVLRVSGAGRKPVEISLHRISEVIDVSPSPKLAWSWDSQYIAVRYDAGEESRVAEVFNVENGRRVWSGNVTEVAWGLAHSLLVVPMYPLDEMQAARGLLVVDVETKRSKKAADAYFFSGEMHSSRSFVVARVAKVTRGVRDNCVIRVDLTNGDARDISCQRED